MLTIFNTILAVVTVIALIVLLVFVIYVERRLSHISVKISAASDKIDRFEKLLNTFDHEIDYVKGKIGTQSDRLARTVQDVNYLMQKSKEE